MFRGGVATLHGIMMTTAVVITAAAAFTRIDLIDTVPTRGTSVLDRPGGLALGFNTRIVLVGVGLLSTRQESIPLGCRIARSLGGSFSITLPGLGGNGCAII